MIISGSVHVAANGVISFLFITNIPFFFFLMCYIFCIYSSVCGHLGGFHVLAVVRSAAVNLRVPVTFLN